MPAFVGRLGVAALSRVLFQVGRQRWLPTQTFSFRWKRITTHPLRFPLLTI